MATPEGKDELKFNEQAFLLDFFDETVYRNIDGNTGRPKSYKNFVQIVGDSAALMNQLMVKGNANKLWGLTTAQMAMLVPKISIYKIKSATEQQIFHFNEFTSIQDLTRETGRGRGTDVGFVSFTWNDMGTNPGNTGLSFEAELKLKFQSFAGIFEPRTGDIKFADLLIPRGATRKQGDLAKLAGPKREVDVTDFQIKAVIGWEVPEDPGRVVFTDSKLITSIRDARVALMLTLTAHEIDIKEDGTIDLTIKYIAALEGRMMSPKMDLIKRDIPVYDLSLKKALEQKRTLVRRVGHAKNVVAKEDKVELPAIPQGDVRHPRIAAAIQKRQTAAYAKKGGKEWLKRTEAKLKAQKNKIARLKQDYKTEAYGRLLKEIETKSRRIFYFSLNQIQIEGYAAMNEETFSDIKDVKLRREKIVSFRRSMKKVIKDASGSEQGFRLQGANENERHAKITQLNTKLAIAANDSRGESENKEDTKKRRDKVLTEFSDNELGGYSGAKNYDLNFFYFGDLINAALQILRDNPATSDIKEDVDLAFGMMIGMTNLYDPDSDEIVPVPLSDIPISLSVFQAWFVKKVIAGNLTSLPLIAFFRSVCAEMITGALSPNYFGTSQKAINTKISTSTIFMNKKSLTSDRAGFSSGRLSSSDLQGDIFKDAVLTTPSKSIQYYFLYVGGNLNQRLLGNRADDEKLGIFHAMIGSDKGLMKKITFKRTDVPYQREARILGSKSEAQKNLLFSDVYNADITMIGNPIFKPGMLLFIDPTALGLGHPPKSVRNMADNWGSQIGIGGYFMITKVDNIIESGKFETSLTLIAQTPLYAIEKVRISQKLRPSRIDYNGPPKPKKSIERTAATRTEHLDPEKEEIKRAAAAAMQGERALRGLDAQKI